MDQTPSDHTAPVADLLRQVLDRFDGIEARLAALEAGDPTASAPRSAPPSHQVAPAPDGTADRTGDLDDPSDQRPSRLSRRVLLTGAAGLTAAGVAVATGASPAAAANGQAILAGQANTASATTTLTNTGGGSALDAINATEVGVGLYTRVGNSSGLSGYAGMVGDSSTRSGVMGLSKSSAGVYGASTNFAGVYGVSSTYIGVSGEGPTSGLSGTSASGMGVNATSTNGIGLQVASEYTHLRFDTPDRHAPTDDTVAHKSGDIVLDYTGVLWACTVGGTPGTWRKLSGNTTAGQFHVTAVPVRIYDSRAGSAGQGPKTKLDAFPRTLATKTIAGGVANGATAVAINVLLVNAANANGNMTIWSAASSQPASNTMVWGAGSGRYSGFTISAVDADAKIKIAASAPTDVVLDVVGYYR